MIRLDRIQIAVEGNHAVPGTVRLEVVLIRTRKRVRLLERTQVRDLRHRPVPVPAQDRIVDIRVTMRTAGTGLERVHRVADKRHVGDTTLEVPRRRRLVRRQTANHHAPCAIRRKAEDVGAEATRVRADRRLHLRALVRRRPPER